MNFAERLTIAVDLVGNAQKMAAATGCSASTVYRALGEDGGKSPPISLATEFAKAAKVRPEWLLLGSGPMRPGEEIEGDFFAVPLVAAEVSAGDGAVVLDEDAPQEIAFRRDWLRRNFGNPESLRAFRVRGESQAPLVNDGEIILVDLSDASLTEGLRLIRVDDALLLKRVLLGDPGKVHLASANPDYPMTTIDLKAHGDSFQVIGRAVWAANKLK